ncbi:uncharacterized protein EI97DRAFT_454427 [Westerdykella ornata]|uniref:Uncharacterized protein n=1 Tax=Westerdykella ornata TaxID=318751 RepID=A0A6A6K1G7_WESOR|nr:uncharacterized protein EI97DRAFT_454427 [Westerdykella ornata]KAF2281219.1 hypothetical protein EI97DRAFT_454427 [Westerdykella ornata]
MAIPPSAFLGVPHGPLNTYVRSLCTYQRRAGRGHSVTLPDVPDFVLEAESPSQSAGRWDGRHVRVGSVVQADASIAELTGAIDGMLGPELTVKEKGRDSMGVTGLAMGTQDLEEQVDGQEGSEWEWESDEYDDDETDVSSECSPECARGPQRPHHEDRSADANGCPDLKEPIKTANAQETPVDEQKKLESKQPALEPQKSALYARAYAACIFEDLTGNTVRKTVAGDPQSVKTYGWEMVSSEQVGNPHLAIAFDESAKAGVKDHVSLVYLGAPQSEFEMLMKRMLNDGSLEGVKGWTSRNPHEALALGEWECHNPRPASAIDADRNAAHSSQECTCKEKTKRVLVCAVRKGEDQVLPLRNETFVWRPKSVEQIKAYAEFARDVVASGVGI